MKNNYKITFLAAFLLPVVAFAQPLPAYVVKKAPTVITIDGVANESAWAVTPETAIDKQYAGEYVTAGAANFKMLYDNENIYVFVDVIDDVITLDNVSEWVGDKVEIYFGLPGYTPGQKADAAYGRQFYGAASQPWVDNVAKLTHPNYYSVDEWPGVGSRDTDGVTFGYKENTSGYSFEFKFNVSALSNIDLTTLDTLAFDFTLADNDIVGDGMGARNRLVYYNTGDLQFKNENWNALDLAKLVFERNVAVDSKTSSEQSAYISNDVLKFKGYNNSIEVEVYSILGQKVVAANQINELNVSNLKKGIYLVRVNNDNQIFKVIK